MIEKELPITPEEKASFPAPIKPDLSESNKLIAVLSLVLLGVLLVVNFVFVKPFLQKNNLGLLPSPTTSPRPSSTPTPQPTTNPTGTTAPTPLPSTDPNIGQNELTSWSYIGPMSYRLIYKYNLNDHTGQYVLQRYDYGEGSNEIVLRNEDYMPIDAVRVIMSPNNSKFIVSGHLGDTFVHTLVGVSENLQALESERLQLQDSYPTTYEKFVAWIDNDRVLIERRVSSEDGSAATATYWVAPVSNLSERQEVAIN